MDLQSQIDQAILDGNHAVLDKLESQRDEEHRRAERETRRRQLLHEQRETERLDAARKTVADGIADLKAKRRQMADFIKVDLPKARKAYLAELARLDGMAMAAAGIVADVREALEELPQEERRTVHIPKISPPRSWETEIDYDSVEMNATRKGWRTLEAAYI